MHEFLIVGAGTAGLSCARRLREAGLSPLVVDKGRGVGGRAATRRVEDQPVDHGLSFFHGADPTFLEALENCGATTLPSWPTRVEGEGKPCRPRAFFPTERRLAFAEGVSAFAKALARDVEVLTSTRVEAIEHEAEGFRVELESADPLRARKIILTPPIEQTRALIEPLAEREEALRPSFALLRMLATEPCLTLIAGYEPGIGGPAWEVLYPNESEVLALISNDSSKRKGGRYLVLVFQCGPRFSRRYLEAEPQAWTEPVLAEATRLVCHWAGRPGWTQTHRWRFARVSAADTLTHPIWVPLSGGRGIGLAGEAFSSGGGVEAAFLSGRRLAETLLGETRP
jgi:renalase